MAGAVGRSDGSKQYGDAIKPDEKVAMPQLIPPWFMPAEPQKYFQDTCDKIGNEFKDFHDTMLDAIGFAHNMWKLQAKFQNLQVMAVVGASGTPGCLDGPELESQHQERADVRVVDRQQGEVPRRRRQGRLEVLQGLAGAGDGAGAAVVPGVRRVPGADGAADAEHPDAAHRLSVGEDDAHRHAERA